MAKRVMERIARREQATKRTSGARSVAQRSGSPYFKLKIKN
jgi:hypothetical protein